MFQMGGLRMSWFSQRVQLVSLLYLAVVLVGCGESEPSEETGPRPVKLLQVQPVAMMVDREFPGRAKAVQSVDLSFKVSGQVTKLLSEGVRAAEGELLAAIDPRDYQTRVEGIEANLAQAQAQLTALRTGARPEDVSRLKSAVRARDAEFNEVSVRRQRNKQLLDDGVVSQQEYDQVQAEYDVAESNLLSAKEDLEIGLKGAREEDIQAQEALIQGLAAQLREASDALDDTQLHAPFDGEVAVTYPDSFEEVQANQPILKFQDVSQIKIDIDISERDMATGASRGASIEEVAKAVNAVAIFTALPGREFAVQVKSFETEADPLTQTFTITLVMNQPEGDPIRPGMNATVKSRANPAGPDNEGIYIPSAAIFADSDGTKLVWIVEDGKVMKRAIAGDEILGGSMHVTDGLQANEVIAVSAVQTLVEGQRVRKMTDLKEL